MKPTLKHTYIIFLQTFLLNFENVISYMVGDNNPYHRKEMLDTNGKYQLEWQVDWSTKRINFTVTAETHGSIGFGLSSNGKMTGADIIIGGVFSGGRSYFKDFHAIGNQMPEVDPSQDWTLHAAFEGAQHTTLIFSRAFDTCDPQDYPITEDKISLIWSFTETDSPAKYHRGNRGEYPVYLLHPDYTPPIVKDPHVGSSLAIDQIEYNHLKTWTVNTRMVIPTEDTTYWCTIHKSPTLPRKHHQVGFEVVFPNKQSRQHVHHLVLSRCRAPQGLNGDSDPNSMFGGFLDYPGQLCYSAKVPVGPMPTEYCTEFYVPWSVGGRPYFHPPHIALPLGQEKDEYYMLQVHYNNPNKLANVFVDLSIDLFYTSNLRENEGGLMVIRHETPGLTPSLLVPPMSLDHQVYGLCGSECTREILPGKGIHINGLVLHTHNTGKLIRLQHFRGNEELPWIQSDDNYDFNYQQMNNLNKEVNVLPGDMLVLKCTYDNTRLNGNTTVGGFSTRQEMCSTWIYYYGRIENYMQCASEIEDEVGRQRFLGIGNVTWSSRDLEFILDSNSPSDRLAGLRVSQVSDNYVNWNEQRREEYQQYILREPHVNKCPRELIVFFTEKGGRWGFLES